MNDYLTFGDVKCSIEVAAERAAAFARDKSSGFLTYDLVGAVMRRQGRLSEIGPWTVLTANALEARVAVKGLRFMNEELQRFADLLNAVPMDKSLDELDVDGLGAVINFCNFAVNYAKAATVTKVGHLYRPHAVPILDRQVAGAYGFTGDQMRNSQSARELLIARIASDIRNQRLDVERAKATAISQCSDLELVSDLRFCDIVIWTVQDDPDGSRWNLKGSPSDRSRVPEIRFYPVQTDAG